MGMATAARALLVSNKPNPATSGDFNRVVTPAWELRVYFVRCTHALPRSGGCSEDP
jgi:hypothetical protein